MRFGATASSIRPPSRRIPASRANERRRSAPHLARHLDDEADLGHFVVERDLVALDGAREAALRREGELVQGRIARRLVDAALQLVLALEPADFGGDEAEHDDLALGQEAQRTKIARARIVIFEEEAVDVDLVEERFGDRVIAALGDPRALEIAAA